MFKKTLKNLFFKLNGCGGDSSDSGGEPQTAAPTKDDDKKKKEADPPSVGESCRGYGYGCEKDSDCCENEGLYCSYSKALMASICLDRS